MPLEEPRHSPLMCLTRDGTGIPHSAQAERLCAAGARWVQLRMKGADPAFWRDEASAAAEACRRHGAVLIVNDSIEVALDSGADGVHLGSADTPWEEARLALGPDHILGGTVNCEEDARRAAEGVLDYAGVGPFRFTGTKARLAPILGMEGVRRLLAELGPTPAWVIGGVTADDLPGLRAAGAAGAAVSSALHQDGRLGENLAALLAAWEGAPAHR